MTTAALYTKIATQQDKFNVSVYPDWRTRGFAWHRACAVELVELMEHLNCWKWWKGPKPDVKQAQMELVDVLHFLVSDLLVGHSHKGKPIGFEEVGHVFENAFSRVGPVEFLDFTSPEAIEGYLARLDSAIAKAASSTLGLDLDLFAQLCLPIGLDVATLGKMYFGKNALNALRQAKGYKLGVWSPGQVYVEGHYVKYWGENYTKEDNEVLFEILEAHEAEISASESPLQTLSKYLESHYPKVMPA